MRSSLTHVSDQEPTVHQDSIIASTHLKQKKYNGHVILQTSNYDVITIINIECSTFMSSRARDFMKIDGKKKYWNWR